MLCLLRVGALLTAVLAGVLLTAVLTELLLTVVLSLQCCHFAAARHRWWWSCGSGGYDTSGARKAMWACLPIP